MEITVKLNLDSKEEELLNRVVDVFESQGKACSKESVLEMALHYGSKWETYIFEKLADMLSLMNGCEVSESQKLVDEYTNHLDTELKAVQVDRKAKLETEQQLSEEIEIGEEVEL